MVYVYGIASVLSAFLVFLIQPVMAKLALPTLGGTPAVWNGCMLFFQAVLLAGYSYAHLLTRLRRQKWQYAAHMALALLIVVFLPLPVGDTGLRIDPAAFPLGWLLVMLSYTVALPFFVISATSPVLQKWFAHTGHAQADNPYFLYAASNIGSMAALLAYPVVIEPFFTLAQQVRMWEYGIMVLFAVFLAVIAMSYRSSLTEKPMKTQGTVFIDSSALTWRRRAKWLFLAFIPASLLYSVTAYITTDLVSAPFLWLLPLTLYLVTFILAFETRLRGFALAERLQLPLVLFALFFFVLPGFQKPIFLVVHVLCFFFVALYVHGLLSKSKPAPEHLTEFFLFMSLGGVLGGVFNTFLAPTLFDAIVEYPLLLLLSCVVRLPLSQGLAQLRTKAPVLIVGILIICAAMYGFWASFDAVLGSMAKEATGFMQLMRIAIMAVAFICAVYFDKTPVAWAVALGSIALMSHVLFTQFGSGRTLHQERTVFGVHRVYAKNGEAHVLVHGTTIHGVQLKDAKHRTTPVAYYYVLKDVFTTRPESLRRLPVAVMGLGSGAIACHGLAGQHFDFFEIDPEVARIASMPEWFSYLSECPPQSVVILGDARQKIARQPKNRYGIIVADTFSSDAIPTHMITKEAVQMYVDRLAEGGVIAFHISNRNIDLKPVLASIARELGLAAVYRDMEKERGNFPEGIKGWIQPSVWVVVARDASAVEMLKQQNNHWTDLTATSQEAVWTDDFSNIFMNLIAVKELREKLNP